VELLKLQLLALNRPVTNNEGTSSSVVWYKKVNSVEVKTVPRRLTAFVGRLHEDTTTKDLTSFLAESGLQGIKCTKLKPPAGRSFRTAAFCVSCPAEGNEHLFYSDDVCPDGAELRDWYFKEKSSKKDECETVQNC